MNSKLRLLLAEYSESHQNATNRKIHKVAVPMIVLSLLGLLSQLSWSWGNAAWIAIILATFYYVQFRSPRVHAAFCLQIIPMMVVIHFNRYGSTVFYVTLFIIGWIAQFVGHHVEGKKPSFLEDLQFLLIGPIWILKDVFWKD